MQGQAPKIAARRQNHLLRHRWNQPIRTNRSAGIGRARLFILSQISSPFGCTTSETQLASLEIRFAKRFESHANVELAPSFRNLLRTHSRMDDKGCGSTRSGTDPLEIGWTGFRFANRTQAISASGFMPIRNTRPRRVVPAPNGSPERPSIPTCEINRNRYPAESRAWFPGQVIRFAKRTQALANPSLAAQAHEFGNVRAVDRTPFRNSQLRSLFIITCAD